MKISRVISKNYFDYFLIFIGSTLLAFGIQYFYVPYNLITGGVSGIAIIIAHYANNIGMNVPIWLTNIVINLPLFFWGMKKIGRQFLIRTIFSTLLLSVSLYYISFIPLPKQQDLVLASIFGGLIAGVGVALVIKALATTGGSDMAAMILHKYFSHISVSKIIFLIDGFIIIAGLLIFGHINTMYALISVYISSKVIDAVLEGVSFAKAAFIISDDSDSIAEKLMYNLERGVTSLSGKGMYTKKDKNILLCVVSNKEIVKLKELVHAIDKNAFVIVADVREALGEGFGKPDDLL